MSCTRPASRLEEARKLARELFGVEGAVSELARTRTRTCSSTPGGALRAKIANAAFGEAELDL